MPKKIIIESFIHHLATAAKNIAVAKESPEQKDQTLKSIGSWEFEIIDSRKIMLRWRIPSSGEREITIPSLHFYTRGDKSHEGQFLSEDGTQKDNERYFYELAKSILLSEMLDKNAN